MPKPTKCTTNTTRSSLTRKQTYTRFLTDQAFYAGYQCGWSNLPRKLKKRWKTSVRKTYYYTKGRICRYNPKMLSLPIPKGIFEMFKGALPINSGTTMCFRRYKPLVAQ